VATIKTISGNQIRDPAHWRAKALDARSVAKTTTNPNIKQKFIVCAEAFDRMAESLEIVQRGDAVL
jgi:hypothetical protein